MVSLEKYGMRILILHNMYFHSFAGYQSGYQSGSQAGMGSTFCEFKTVTFWNFGVLWFCKSPTRFHAGWLFSTHFHSNWDSRSELLEAVFSRGTWASVELQLTWWSIACPTCQSEFIHQQQMFLLDFFLTISMFSFVFRHSENRSLCLHTEKYQC